MNFFDENFYRLIDLVHASIYWKDKEGRYLGCNKYVLDMAGFSKREEIIGKTDYDLWKQDANQLTESDRLAIQNGKYEGEEITTIANGKTNIYLTIKNRLLDSEGNIVGVIGTSLDITAQKKLAEFEKQKIILGEQSKVAQIINLVSASIYWKDPAGQYLGCNTYVLNMFGLQDQNELLGKTDYDFLKLEEAAKTVEIDQSVMKTGYYYGEEVGQVHGEEKTYFTIKNQLKDNEGNVIGIVGISLDITAQKKLVELEKQKIILREQAKVAQIIDAANASIYWKDLKGMVLGCNRYMLNMFGAKSNQDIIGKNEYDLLSQEEAKKIHDIDQSVIQNGHYVGEEAFTTSDGMYRTYFTTKNQWLDEQNKVIGIIGTSVDITAQKEVERLNIELKNKIQKVALEEREKYGKLMEILAGTVAHEVRNPLNSLSLCLDNFQEFLNDNHPKIEAFFEKMKTIVMGMSTITDLILNNLKVSTSREIDKRYFKKCSIAHDIAESLKDYFFKEPAEKELIHWHKMGKDFFYTGDALLTKHMFFNLLKNALWAIKEADKGAIWISVNTQPKKWNELIFKDTALGISPDIQEKLFTQFHSRKSTGDGTGLGLTFCRLVMQAYGGTIKCRSEEGKYTEFILRFPK